MIKLHNFTFNPFQENTYILSDDTKECVIIDPGCWDQNELNELSAYINNNDLEPKLVLNTHCHIDHILGNKAVCDAFGIELYIPEGEMQLLERGEQMAQTFGLSYDGSPDPTAWIVEGENIRFGNSELEVIACSGHSPAHIVLYDRTGKMMVGGDVLFLESIGRTDLPGGDHDTLIRNIKEKLFVLDEDIEVHPGHGPTTTIGHEKRSNPFL